MDRHPAAERLDGDRVVLHVLLEMATNHRARRSLAAYKEGGSSPMDDENP